jgi:hypothetical protein
VKVAKFGKVPAGKVAKLGKVPAGKVIRNEYVRIRLTSLERKQIQRGATLVNMTISDFVRKIVKDKYLKLEGQIPMFKK